METLQSLISEYTAELANDATELEQKSRSKIMQARQNGEVQKRIEQLISSLPTIIIALSRDNSIVMWNATF